MPLPFMIWVIVGVLLGLFTAVAVVRAFRRSHQHIVCQACGYLLSGLSPEQRQCPECGVLFTQYPKVMPGQRYIDRRWARIAVVAIVIELVGFLVPGSVLLIYYVLSP
jgi:hypothetical protein